MTKQRKAIIDTIRDMDRHMTAEEIYVHTRERMPSVAMATVYNNLKALAAEGKLRRLRFPGEPDRYDRNTMYHEHLICEVCGEVTDADVEEFLPGLERQLGTHITRYSLSLYHICAACAGKGAGENPAAGMGSRSKQIIEND